MGYGPTARYVLCPTSVCGVPTRKTLPEPPTRPAPTLPTPREVPVKATTGSTSVAPIDPVTLRTHSATVLFAAGSSELTSAAKQNLTQLAPLMRGAREVSIKSRPDASGNAAVRERLAVQRARAVYDFLRLETGADVSLFKIRAPDDCCAGHKGSKGTRAMNRHTEVDVVYPIPQKVIRAG